MNDEGSPEPSPPEPSPSEPSPSEPPRYAHVPQERWAPFLAAQRFVEDYFARSEHDPTRGYIGYGGQRYILVRAASMGFHFVQSVRHAQGELLGEDAAVRAARSVLYDVSHAAGRADAESFLESQPGLQDPVRRLATGPTHFAHIGWGVVRILADSVTSGDQDDYCLNYEHQSSFEAAAWLEAGQRSPDPVCVMNAGYSSGWCEIAFGLELQAVEVLCEARGDPCCRFVMAPPNRLAERVEAMRAAHPDQILAELPPYVGSERYLLQLARAYRELEASERLYRALFTDTQDVVLVSSPQGALVKANAAGVGFLGLPAGSVPGADLARLIKEPPHRKLVERVQSEGSYEGDVRFVTPQGQERVGLASVVAAAEPTPELRWIVHDITQRLLYEERLRERQHLESLGSLAAGVAHDFNNLLAATLNSVALLEARAEQEPSCLEAVRTIRAATERGRDLTHRLLSYARGGRYEVHPTSVNAVVEAVLALLQPTLDPRITIVSRLDPDTPQIMADRAQLESALLNVCLNARDAMPRGGTLTVATQARTASTLLELEPRPISQAQMFAVVSVSDTGHGMSAEVLRQAREPFFTTKTRGHGTGLGLAMVEGVVRNHHGYLEIESQPGEGTQVLLHLPAGDDPGSSVEALPLLRSVRAGFQPAHVLVVDDTEPVATSTARLLEMVGHQATIELSGEGALARLEEGLVCDVVLLDLLLPGLDGRQTLERIRELRPQLPVIVFSGYAQQDQIASLVEGGISFLPKPFELEELLEQVRLAVQG